MHSRSCLNIPDGYEVPEGRVKPWGTAHAVLSCIDQIDGPFAVINADDYYGVEAFKLIYDYLESHPDDDKYRYTMVGYYLGNTVTDNGHVARGICTMDENGKLVKIEERRRSRNVMGESRLQKMAAKHGQMFLKKQLCP